MMIEIPLRTVKFSMVFFYLSIGHVIYLMN